MNIELWPVDRPQPYGRNARKISDLAVDKVARSLKEFGWRQPVVVDGADVIIAGHTRLLAAKKNGEKEVPVHVALGLTDEQVKAYRLMDNRSHEEAEWDLEMLGSELFDLKALGLDLGATGFDKDELAGLFAARTAGLTEDDAAPDAPEDPATRLGDIWILDRHRLLCGDSTSITDVERLMDGQKAVCMWTDPPYGVNYTGKTKKKLKIENDGPCDLDGLLMAAFECAGRALEAGAAVYVAHPAGALNVTFGTAFLAAGWRLHQTLIWDKGTIVLGHSDYHFAHEPIFYGYTPAQGRHGRGGRGWYGGDAQRSILAYPKPSRSESHPTMKPIALVQCCLENSTQTGTAVLDLFGGSGSTLIACEKTGRKAFLMELDPAYVDVIVKRWQDFTGKRAVLAASGCAFDDICAERAGAAA